jgi:hypothetical protein
VSPEFIPDFSPQPEKSREEITSNAGTAQRWFMISLLGGNENYSHNIVTGLRMIFNIEMSKKALRNP